MNSLYIPFEVKEGLLAGCKVLMVIALVELFFICIRKLYGKSFSIPVALLISFSVVAVTASIFFFLELPLSVVYKGIVGGSIFGFFILRRKGTDKENLEQKEEESIQPMGKTNQQKRKNNSELYNSKNTDKGENRNQTKNDYADLYSRLMGERSGLSSCEIDLLISDFKTKGTKVFLKDGLDYSIQYGIKDGFNGFLMMNERDKTIYVFQVNQTSRKEQIIKTVTNAVSYYINCKISPISPVIIEGNLATTETEGLDYASLHANNTDVIISQLERLEKLYSSGAITKDDFEKLKAELLNKEQLINNRTV